MQIMRKIVRNYDTNHERNQMAEWNGGIEAAKEVKRVKHRRNF